MAFSTEMERYMAAIKGAEVITREQAIYASEFHFTHGDKTYGPRGGVQYPRIEVWRRNGKTQTWKRSPERFRIPVKFGLYSYGSITERDVANFHTSEDCPLLIKSRESDPEKLEPGYID